MCIYTCVCVCAGLFCLFIYKQNLLFFRPPTEAIPQASAAYSRLAWNIYWTNELGSSKGNFTAFPEKRCETSIGNRKKGLHLEVIVWNHGQSHNTLCLMTVVISKLV